MDFLEFEKIVADKKNLAPRLFERERDVIATDLDIFIVEDALGVKLPTKYKQFVKNYGGGDFAYVDIFSVDKTSDWYIVDENKKLSLPKNFIAISDDGTGGYYGYLVHDSQCGEEIYYWDHDENFGEGAVMSKKSYNDIFEYIVDYGLGEGDLLEDQE